MRYNLVIRNEGKGGASHAYADALLTPAVAGVMYAASAVVAGASIVELHKEEKQDLTSAAKKLPTMAVMSALVFAGR